MSTPKKYGGRIERWWKEEFPEYKDTYGPSLGYVIHGWLGSDPTDRGFRNSFIRTSLVVKHDDRTIETLNTRYDLGDKLIDG